MPEKFTNKETTATRSKQWQSALFAHEVGRGCSDSDIGKCGCRDKVLPTTNTDQISKQSPRQNGMWGFLRERGCHRPTNESPPSSILVRNSQGTAGLASTHVTTLLT